MELQDYLRALRHHWIGVFLLVVLAGVAALGVSLTQDKVYAANANGFVGTGQSDNAATGSINDQLARSRATSYVDIAKSRATAESVIENLGIDASPSALVGRISVEQPIDTVLIKITARAGSPREAQDLADAWVKALARQIEGIEAPSGKLTDGTPRLIPVESAELPTAPISPNIPRNTVLGLIVGVLLGLGYAVLRSTLDRRIHRAEDVEARFTAPVVASIPAAPVLKHDRGARATIAVDGSGSLEGFGGAAESFRKLRTNLVYMDVDNPPRVLVVTSPKPGDGKSTVAANIASALASAGQPVILIDADLRRPTVADSFGIDNAAGLTTVLSGQLSAEDVLQTSAEHPQLQLMGSGPIPPNPSELLGSQAMRTLVRKLGTDAYVVLDAPPLLPVTDAAILATAADGAFVVISSGRTLDTELGQCLSSLEAVSARALGVIINRVPTRRGMAGYYGYYGPYAPTSQPDKGDDAAPTSSGPKRRGKRSR